MNWLEEYNTKELYIRHAIDPHPDDKYFLMHVHERYEIYYFLSGDAEYLVEGSRYPLKPGSLLIMRPAESHKAKIKNNKSYERFAINFSLPAVECIDPKHQLLAPFDNRPLGRGNLYTEAEFEGISVKRMFEKMCSQQQDTGKQELKILTYLFPLLDMINEAYQAHGAAEYQPPQSISEQIVTYVNLHLFEELSIPLLAEHFFLSTSQFGRIFKQATGAAPWEYITIKRLTAAKEKIRSGSTVQNACTGCGFGDYSTFYRAYVKQFGCAPKEDA